MSIPTGPTPYYQDEFVTLFHGDCREVLAGMADQSVDAVITDPPYTERTHSKARSLSHRVSGRDVISQGVTAFAAIDDEELRAVLTDLGRVTRSWVVATLDYRHAFEFDAAPPAGLKVQRVGVWMKTSPTPQITGDRPAQGWEAIAYMHRAKGRSAWNGGGHHGNYYLDIERKTGHPTAKPLPMVQDMIRKFTNRGDTVLDPFAGSGTTLRAAVNEGRKAIGVELDERYCEVIAKRLDQYALDFGGA